MRRHGPILVGVVFLWVVVARLARLEHPVRVGDGSEYYAMFFAWHDTLRPFMTAHAWTSYADFVDRQTVDLMQPVGELRDAFPSLIQGPTADFNHFWLYPAAAAVVAGLLSALHVRASPHTAFVVLHALLLAWAVVVGWAQDRWRGAGAVLLVLALSPTLWYVDKVHTELFTVATTTVAVALFARRRFLWCAAALALASTQNISFAAIAGLVLAMDYTARPSPRSYRFGEVAVVGLTAALMLVHPTYYLSRLGVLTPQLLAGGAKVGFHAGRFLVWLVDPDLGLLPNWPLLTLVAIVVAVTVRARATTTVATRTTRGATRGEWIVFIVAYLGLNLFAQSSTQNLNSAATPGLARYGLWYVALSLPLFQRLLDCVVRARPGPTSNAIASRRRLAEASVAVAAIAFGGAYASRFFAPTVPDAGPDARWTHPSPLSAFIQTTAPWLYDPPAEVFAERFSHLGEDPRVRSAIAIVGPDCRKVLVQPGAGDGVLGGNGCAISAPAMRAVLARHPDARAGEPHYLTLSEDEAASARAAFDDGAWYPVVADSEAARLLAGGWNVPEAWGVWSSGTEATMVVPCRLRSGASVRNVALALRGFVVGRHDRVRVDFRIAGSPAGRAAFRIGGPDEESVDLPVPPSACRGGPVVRIDAAIDSPASPAELGLSGDRRSIGVGLLRMRLSS